MARSSTTLNEESKLWGVRDCFDHSLSMRFVASRSVVSDTTATEP